MILLISKFCCCCCFAEIFVKNKKKVVHFLFPAVEDSQKIKITEKLILSVPYNSFAHDNKFTFDTASNMIGRKSFK